MAVDLLNYAYSYKNAKGKPVFVPTEKTRALASEIRASVEERIHFEPYYYHFSEGAHVAALHEHRRNIYFARLDLKNFFYSVGRNKVKSTLKAIGVANPERYARWSCVKNPYDTPRYALPYGFPQSPILATLVLRQSSLGTAIQALPDSILRSVYLDDIAISATDRDGLEEAFISLVEAAAASGFALNDEKITPPAETISLFNCDLSHGQSIVSTQRIEAFYARERNEDSVAGFETYKASVEAGNG